MEQAKLARLDAVLAERDLAAVWFARPTSFTWLTGGSNVVDPTGDVGVGAVGYDGDGLTVVTNNIEASRLREEELADEVTVEAFEWYDGSLPGAVAEHSPTPAAADFDVPGFESVDASPIRQPLTEPDVERYRSLSTDTAAVVETVCRDIEADDTERDVAARLRGALWEQSVDPKVVLVGGSERAQAYRHFVPADTELGAYATVSVTARRDGLNASCSRTVAIDPPGWLADRHDAAMTVDATAIVATRAVASRNGDAGDVFAHVKDAYEAVGFPGEWQHHHQGGAAGFAGREWIATPDSTAPVTTPMAYAWNPTVQGAKSEDTVLVREDDIEVLTATGDWPRTDVAAHGFDATIERPEILTR